MACNCNKDNIQTQIVISEKKEVAIKKLFEDGKITKESIIKSIKIK